MRVIVKGSSIQAAEAAKLRDIPATVVTTTTKGECILEVAHTHLGEVVRWYCEDSGAKAPYLVGTCLFYQRPEHTLREEVYYARR